MFSLNNIERIVGLLGLIFGAGVSVWKACTKILFPFIKWIKEHLNIENKIEKIDIKIDNLLEDFEKFKIKLIAHINLTGAAFYEADPDTGYYNHVNRAWSDLHGMQLEEALGNNWLKAVKESDKIQKIWETTIKSKSLFEEKYTIINQNTGEEIMVKGLAEFAKSEDGKIILIIGAVNKFISNKINKTQ